MIKIDLSVDEIYVIRMALKYYKPMQMELAESLAKSESGYCKYVLEDIDVINNLLNNKLNFWKGVNKGETK